LFFDALTRFYDLSEVVALEMFARNGQMTLARYASKVREVEAWELNPEHEAALRAIGPNVEVKIGCAYLAASWKDRRFDLVVLDAPQGAHKDWSGGVRFEHFHAIDHLSKLVRPRSIVVVPVNKAPYDRAVEGEEHGYDRYDEYDFKAWMRERQSFYSHSPYKISEAVALHAYDRVLSFQRLEVVNVLMSPVYSDVPRKENYMFWLALELVRR
jgi:hypothetical protein